MFGLFKKKKETFNTGEIHAFLPQILREKETHLEELLLLQQKINDKLDALYTSLSNGDISYMEYEEASMAIKPVSYTHLTLPTNREG